MRSRSFFMLAAIVVAAMLASVGCADFHRGPAPRDGGTDGSEVADLAFEKLVYPILESDCGYCHLAGGAASSSNFVLMGNADLDRAMVVALVTPGNPGDSMLLMRAIGDGHAGGQRFTTDSLEYQTIANWILGLP
jgi:hypothetical protein